MTCSINKCLDYTKSTANINLVPANETLDLSATLTTVVRIVGNHLNSALTIVLNPLSPGICPVLISNKHCLQ